jgi:hypothetical protein
MKIIRFCPCLVLALGLLFSVGAKAQNFLWSAKLPVIEKEGFYSIQISPEISAKLKSDFSDIRILDENKNQVSYFLKTDELVTENSRFKELPIVEKRFLKNATRIVIENPDKLKLTSLCLFIRNAEVHKWLKLSASDDKNQWFVLKDNYVFRSFFSQQDESVIQILDFPVNNYRFYELLINDYFDNPVNILKAGYYDYATEMAKFQYIASPEISYQQNVSSKESLVKLKFKEKYKIDKLEFIVDDTKFFHREAQIVELLIVKKKFKRKIETFSQVSSFLLSSNRSNTVYLNDLKTDEVLVRIQDNDDKPLKFKVINAYQLNSALVTYLKPSGKYSLVFGCEQANRPIYDFEHFRDSLPKDVLMLKVGKIEKNGEMVSAVKLSPNSLILWLGFGLVAAILLLLSMKLVKEMKNKQPKD